MGLKRFVLASMLCLGALSAAQAQGIVLKIHPDTSAGSMPFASILAPWMKRIEAQSSGRIKFEVNAQASDYRQLGKTPADLIWSPVTATGKREKSDLSGDRTEVFELPFMLSNPEAVSQALWEYVEAFATDEFKDVRLIALHVQGPGILHTSNRAIHSLDDLKSLHISSDSPRVGQLLKIIDDKLPAKESGNIKQQLDDTSIDGVVTDWHRARPLAADNLIRHHTEFDSDTGALFTRTYVLAMDMKKYDSLPEDLKKIIDANSGITTSAEMGRLAGQLAQSQRDEVLKLTGENAVITMSAADSQAFRKASMKVDQTWVAEINRKGYDGQKLLDGAKTLIKKHTK